MWLWLWVISVISWKFTFVLPFAHIYTRYICIFTVPFNSVWSFQHQNRITPCSVNESNRRFHTQSILQPNILYIQISEWESKLWTKCAWTSQTNTYIHKSWLKNEQRKEKRMKTKQNAIHCILFVGLVYCTLNAVHHLHVIHSFIFNSFERHDEVSFFRFLLLGIALWHENFHWKPW